MFSGVEFSTALFTFSVVRGKANTAELASSNAADMMMVCFFIAILFIGEKSAAWL